MLFRFFTIQFRIVQNCNRNHFAPPQGGSTICAGPCTVATLSSVTTVSKLSLCLLLLDSHEVENFPLRIRAES